MPILTKDIQRFETKFVKGEPDECWEWLAWRDKDGYGNTTLSGKFWRANRASYRIYKGKIEDGLHVLHTCANPPCVNPNHLFLGTSKDNVNDMLAKGRGNPPKGENHPMATASEERKRLLAEFVALHPEVKPRGENHKLHKLTEDDVRLMRILRNEGVKLQELADRFNVCLSVACNIVRNVTWQHVT